MSVSSEVLEPLTVTPLSLVAAKSPAAALIFKVTVSVSASRSLKVMALKSRSLVTFWVIVMLNGNPVAVGSSLSAVMVINACGIGVDMVLR